MPIATIKILEGRDQDTKNQLMRRVTDAIASTLKIGTDTVRIIIDEVPPGNFARGGKTMLQIQDNSQKRK